MRGVAVCVISNGVAVCVISNVPCGVSCVFWQRPNVDDVCLVSLMTNLSMLVFWQRPNVDDQPVHARLHLREYEAARRGRVLAAGLLFSRPRSLVVTPSFAHQMRAHAHTQQPQADDTGRRYRQAKR